MADDGGGTAQQTTVVGQPFSWFNAIARSLKNNDQKDIPLDDRNWAEARDVSIVERSARAGDMPFVTDLRGRPSWIEARVVTDRVLDKP